MKTLGHLSPTAAPLAVVVSLVLFAGGTYASGPAGGGTTGGANGTAAGTSTVGAPGAGSAGAGRGSVSTGQVISGGRTGVTFSNNPSINTARAGNGTFAHGSTLRGGGASSSVTLPYRNAPNVGTVPAGSLRATNTPGTTRPANAWSGTAVGPANNAVTARNNPRSSHPANGWTASGFTGQRLDAGAPGANLPTYNQGDFGNRGGRNGNFRSRFPGRYYYYPYAYGPGYAPYISYYSGSYAGAYPYYNEVPAADTQFGEGATTVQPQYVEQTPANSNNDQPDAQQPSAPVPQRQAPSNANPGTIPNNGPDSLVEAVQEELVRRGYYAGKVDAMFNTDTKEALRKFQTDHHLADTGLINEATLHALQLD